MKMGSSTLGGCLLPHVSSPSHVRILVPSLTGYEPEKLADQQSLVSVLTMAFVMSLSHRLLLSSSGELCFVWVGMGCLAFERALVLSSYLST